MRQRKLKVKSIERKRSSGLKRLKYVQKKKPRWKKCNRLQRVLKRVHRITKSEINHKSMELVLKRMKTLSTVVRDLLKCQLEI